MKSVKSENHKNHTSKILQSTTLRELQKIYTIEELKQRIDFVLGYKPQQIQETPPQLIRKNHIKPIPYDERSTITPAQQRQIQDLVSEKVNNTNCNLTFQSIYYKLKKEFKIAKYNQLKQVDFDYAMRCIEFM